jgi:hypothetical protein
VAAAAPTAAVVEARTVVAAEAHTGIANPSARTMARSDFPGGLFVSVSTSTEVFESQFTNLPPHPRVHNSSVRRVLHAMKHFVFSICCFDMGKMRGKCPPTAKC